MGPTMVSTYNRIDDTNINYFDPVHKCYFTLDFQSLTGNYWEVYQSEDQFRDCLQSSLVEYVKTTIGGDHVLCRVFEKFN